MAHTSHLRPGDRALMRGTLHVQTIAFANGEQAIVNHSSVTSIEVLARSKRTSITVYEQASTKRTGDDKKNKQSHNSQKFRTLGLDWKRGLASVRILLSRPLSFRDENFSSVTYNIY